MNRLNLNDIALPARLSETVDAAVLAAQSERHSARRIFPIRRAIAAAAAVLVMTALLLNISAVAAFVGRTFMSLQDGFLKNPSRAAIVEHDFPETVAESADAVSESGGAKLTLDGYYVDATEIGFEFTLTGGGIPDSWALVHIPDMRLEITDESGEVKAWESFYDRAAQIDKRTFPGGYFYHDFVTDEHAYVESAGQDFILHVDVQTVGEGVYKLDGIVTFQKPVEVGAQMNLRLGDIYFVNFEDNDGAPMYDVIAGTWDFHVDVDGRFAAADTLEYAVTDTAAAAKKGITIKSVSVTPSGCRIEAAIDYRENGLADPDNANEDEFHFHKFNVMETNLEAEANGKLYTFHESGNYNVSGEATDCYFILYSMYFENLDSFTLRFFERDGGVIEIPLVQVKN